MKFSEVELPSNKKFGFFFTIVFAVLAFYFFIISSTKMIYIFAASSFIFFVITVFSATYLLPLNKLWMRFGLLLGSVFTPIILGLMFFGIFTPIAFFMKISGRDELRLKIKNRNSHWIIRTEPIEAESFRNQF